MSCFRFDALNEIWFNKYLLIIKYDIHQNTE